MAEVFVDANVFIRHLTNDHSDHSPKATAFFQRVESGELLTRTSETVIFETVFTLQRRYRASKASIRDALLPLVEMPAIRLAGKPRLRRAFELYVESNLSFGDAYNVAVMEHLRIREIATFDRDFERVPGIKRVEPG